ncbi:MAG: dTDP-4-dehydrorhamnose reductase [Paenalcaligenes sp.]
MSMQKLKVLITGANGQLGYELCRSAPTWVELIPLTSVQLNITDEQAVNKELTRVSPDLIINAAAFTAVDKAEEDVEKAYAVNRDGIEYLGRYATGAGIPVFHVSTDYVFDGDAIEPYVENDITAPTGVYGASKLAGEQALQAVCKCSLIMRISWVFGVHGANFVKTMLRVGATRTELGVVTDQQGCPTSAASVAVVLWRLAEIYKQNGELQWGVYHFSGTPTCSWYDFAQEIFTQAGKVGLLKVLPVVNMITTAQYPTPAKRPAYSVLSSEKLQTLYGVQPADWRNELTQVLKELHAQEQA